MARREDAPSEDVSDEEFGYDYTDDYADHYKEHPEGPTGYWTEPTAPARRPWHRNPIVLLGLIAAASVALATAAVMLLTTAGRDDSPTRVRPTIKTTAVSVSPSQRVPQTTPTSRSPETTPGTSTSASSDAASTAAENPAAPTEAPAQPPSARPTGSGEPGGPRINVTRSPMSFTPGSRG